MKKNLCFPEGFLVDPYLSTDIIWQVFHHSQPVVKHSSRKQRFRPEREGDCELRSLRRRIVVVRGMTDYRSGGRGSLHSPPPSEEIQPQRRRRRQRRCIVLAILPTPGNFSLSTVWSNATKSKMIRISDPRLDQSVPTHGENCGAYREEHKKRIPKNWL